MGKSLYKKYLNRQKCPETQTGSSVSNQQQIEKTFCLLYLSSLYILGDECSIDLASLLQNFIITIVAALKALDLIQGNLVEQSQHCKRLG